MPPLPSPTLTEFFTVREAATLTGKSLSSIRRVIHPIRDNPDHPDRSHIQPSIEEAQELRLKAVTFAWKISEELLRREVPVEPPPEKGTPAETPGTASDLTAALVAMLRRELEVKNEQMARHAQESAKLMELNSTLLERIRESNILLGSLQRQLALTDGQEKQPPQPLRTKQESRSQEKGKKAASKGPKLKRGFFARLFS